MPLEHFRSRESYRKNLAFRHIHRIPFRADEVEVAGRRHKVKHSGRAADRKRKRSTRNNRRGR